MSGSNGYTTNVFKSPHGVIGGHVPNPTMLDPPVDLGGLSLMPRDEATTSKASRDSAIVNANANTNVNVNGTYTRGPFEPSSIWSKPRSETNHGWDRVNANHFASRPPSPTKQNNLLTPDPMIGVGAGLGVGAAPKTAPIPPSYAAFNPVITPPQPSAVPLPQRRSSPSPPNERGRDTVNQAGYHLQQLQYLVGPLVARQEEMDRLGADAAKWKANCDAATAEVARLQSLVNAQESTSANNVAENLSFIAIVIDGDSLLFHEKYMKGGLQGGQAAARALIKAVTEPDSEEKPNVMVHIFFNRSSLGNGLIRAGLISQWSVFDGFWHGFSAHHGLINVVDVGPGKDTTQAKIDEHVKFYSTSQQCSRVIVGSNKPLNAYEMSEKISLIQSSPDPSNAKVQSYPDLFRTDPLPVIPISFSSIVSSAPQTPRRQDPIFPVPELDHDNDHDNDNENDNTSSSPSASASPSAPEDLEVEVEVFDWEELPKQPNSIDEWTEAGGGKKGHKKPTAKSAASGAGTQGGKKGHSRDNTSGSSKGTPGVKKDRKSKRGGVKHKKDYGVRDMKPRPCHSHFLSPTGCRQDACHYGHEYELGDDQLNELATLAKQIPCPFARTKRCHFDNETCIYGHLCPRGSRCTFEECRFDDIDPDHQDWAQA